MRSTKIPCPYCKFCSKTYESVKIVAILDQMTEAPYPLQKVLDEDKELIRIFVERNGIAYTWGVFTAKL